MRRSRRCAQNTGSMPNAPFSRACRRALRHDSQHRSALQPFPRPRGGGFHRDGFPRGTPPAGRRGDPPHAATTRDRLFRRHRRRSGNTRRSPLHRPWRPHPALSRWRDTPGYSCEAIKAQCIAAGLPVIDSRCVAFDIVAQLTLGGPLVAVGREPEPAPWHGLAYAPLHAVAIRYAAARAEIWNIPGVETIPVPARRRSGP